VIAEEDLKKRVYISIWNSAQKSRLVKYSHNYKKTLLRMYHFVFVFTVNKASIQKLLPGFKL
jgi:hypothetical protein